MNYSLFLIFKEVLFRPVCFTLSLLLFAIVTVRKITDEKEIAVKLLGTISSVASVAMFSSPLTSLVRSTPF